jgi:hypothetical protein
VRWKAVRERVDERPGFSCRRFVDVGGEFVFFSSSSNDILT